MPRPHRLWIPDGIYHITLRGNNREPLFLDSADYQQYLIELRNDRPRLLAFALMPNHVHLLMRGLPYNSISQVMHRLATRYTHYFNARHGRVGHLYQGRFYSNLVDRDSYLLEVSRYIHLNPVRARLVRCPQDYVWSSYQRYVGLAHDLLGIVDARPVLSLFGVAPGEQAAAYRAFVERLAEEDWEGWVQGLYQRRLIPSPAWLKKCQALFPKKVPGTFQ